MEFIRYALTPSEKYDGVRPINVYMLRLFYFLMPVFVGTWAWRVILTHDGPWDPFRAAAIAVWAAYPTLSILGLVHPVRMLPLFLFMLFYKTIWMAAVAYPLWAQGALWGTPTGDMARDMLGLPLGYLIVPWGYVWRTYVLPPRRRVQPAG